MSLNSRQRYGSPVYENSRNGCTETIGTGVRKRSERAEQADPAWKTRYRADRPIVERKIAHFTRRPWGGRKARTRGLERVATDLDTRAGAVNWARLAVLGLHHGDNGWAIA